MFESVVAGRDRGKDLELGFAKKDRLHGRQFEVFGRERATPFPRGLWLGTDPIRPELGRCHLDAANAAIAKKSEHRVLFFQVPRDVGDSQLHRLSPARAASMNWPMRRNTSSRDQM